MRALMAFAPYHQIDFTNVWDGPQYFFKKDFAYEACTSCEEYVLTAVKFFDFQLWLTLVLA
jgi:hypothetical protein